MVNSVSESAGKPLFVVLLLFCFMVLDASVGSAQEGPDENALSQTRPRRVVNSPVPEVQTSDSSSAQLADTPVIAYALYKKSFSFQPSAPGNVRFSSGAEPRSASKVPRGRTFMALFDPPTPPAVSTAPMSVGEKFQTWFKGHFLSIGAYVGSVPRGMFTEVRDNDDFKKDTFENFLADSMTRAARSFASSATNGFYEQAVLASLFKQDPRYHRSGKKGGGARLLYAVTRVFVTQGDRCACNQFNASFLLGGAAGAATANLWERSERGGRIHMTRRWLNHILFTAGGNLIKEFVGGQ